MKKTVLQHSRDELERMVRNAHTIEFFDRYLNHSKDQDLTPIHMDGLNHYPNTWLICHPKEMDALHKKYSVNTAPVGSPTFAAKNPPQAVVHHHAIALLMREAQQITRVADQLLGIMIQKNIY